MRFPPKPDETKGQVDRAGRILIDPTASQSERDWAINLAERWRACHAYPINTFQATLYSKLSRFDGDPSFAQRLKRMPTIIEKLKRESTMELSRMQDIAGVRAIMRTPDDVIRLVDIYKNNSRFFHELSKEKDYINFPRSSDGYRSIHLVYKYKGQKTSAFDGLRLEMQFRTKLQHIWATAVETMGFVLDQRLKSRQGEPKWQDFFAVASSAFAYKEGTPLVPRFSHLSEERTIEELSNSEKLVDALKVMSGVSVATERIVKEQKGYGWHLLILNMKERVVNVRGYARGNFAEAEKDLSDVERLVDDGEELKPVLVSAGSLDRLRRAYPNFFLDIREFAGIVAQIVGSEVRPVHRARS